MGPQDPQDRIADLENQLASAQRIAQLERELAAAKAGEQVRGMDTTVDVAVSRPQVSSGRRIFANPTDVVPAPLDTRLADAPRRVPMTFLLAELLPFRWWYVWALFMVLVAPIVVWIREPAIIAPAAVLTMLVIYAFQMRSALTRRTLLKWGQVATVTGTERSRASYYSGTTWYNAPLPVAHGWKVQRPLWSGPSTKTVIHYTLGDYEGELRVSGREYIDGVVLADARNPRRARCVTYFPYDLDRDASGNWVGRLRPRLVLGMVVWSVILLCWLAIAAATGTGFAQSLFTRSATMTIPVGGTAHISGNSRTKTVNCNDGYLSVGGNSMTVIAHGHCSGLTVSGNNTTVAVDSADTITLNGIGDKVTFHSGSPNVVHGGIGNSAQQG